MTTRTYQNDNKMVQINHNGKQYDARYYITRIYETLEKGLVEKVRHIIEGIKPKVVVNGRNRDEAVKKFKSQIDKHSN